MHEVLKLFIIKLSKFTGSVMRKVQKTTTTLSYRKFPLDERKKKQDFKNLDFMKKFNQRKIDRILLTPLQVLRLIVGFYNGSVCT